MSEIPTVELPSGSRMPRLGLGTYDIVGVDAVGTIARAITTGYRLFDTAAAYENEPAVGGGLREGTRDMDLAREDFFICTKIRRRTESASAAVTAVREACRSLAVSKIDLVLVHGPNASREIAFAAWRGLQRARDLGLVTNIGVSNFSPAQIEQLVNDSDEWPVVSQVQLSPALQRRDDVSFYEHHGIIPMAWSPLGKAHGVLEHPTVTTLARRHGVSPAAVGIRWGLQRGHVVIPKSSSPTRQRDNLGALAFTLSPLDMSMLDDLDTAEQSAWEAENRAAW